MTLDLSFGTREAATKGAWLHLLHPVTREPLFAGQQPDPVKQQPGTEPVRWLIAGRDSEQYQKAQNAQQTRRIEDSAKTKAKTLTGERFTAEALDLLAACVLNVEHSVFEGVALVAEFNQIRAVLKREPWIAEQIDEFVMDRATFLAALKTT